MTVAPVAKPGCVALMPSHPYTQVRFINEGEADVWTEGEESAKQRLKAGDILALPPLFESQLCLSKQGVLHESTTRRKNRESF